MAAPVQSDGPGSANASQYHSDSTGKTMASPPPLLSKRRRSSAVTRATDDTETCRICRGEATSSESLFYPCKCSGSIKYVHQDCLMEWLSHSQKKYCELCKTPFTFTKLYHPQMPSSIPTTVFLKRALLHISSWLLVWTRAALVGFVWLVALPYAMRVVWRGLFWLADGGWARDRHVVELMVRLNNSAAASPKESAASVSVPTSNGTLFEALPEFLRPLWHSHNATTGSPSLLSLLSRYLSLGLPSDANVTSSQATQTLLVRRLDSLLSDVSTLQHLTRWPAVNRAVTDVLEGLIISLSVVVAFILVFLIREWVVQQQPLLNMHVEENNPAAAVQEQVAEVQNVEEELETDGHHYDAPDEGEGLEDIQLDVDTFISAPEPVDLDPVSAQQRAEATINQLPPDVQQAVRRGRLQEIVQNIKALPPDEAARVKRLVMEWARAKVENSEVGVTRETSSDRDVPHHGTADSSRPLLEKGRSALAYEVNRGMEEDGGTSPHRADLDNATPLQHDWSRLKDETAEPQAGVPESWDDEPTVSSAATQQQTRDNDNDINKRESLPPLPLRVSYSGYMRGAHVNVADAVESMGPLDSPGYGFADSPVQEFGQGPFNNESSELADGAASGSTAPSMDFQVLSRQNTNSSHAATIGSERQTSEGEASVALAPLRPTSPQDSTPTEPSNHTAPPPATPPSTTVAPVNLADRVLDYIYGDLRVTVPVTADPNDEEHIVQDIAEEAPFVPFADNQPALGQELVPAGEEAQVNAAVNQDPELLDAAAAAAGGFNANNQDVVDDAEDLEGILELIGMQGPITGLLQNALFSAVLISISISAAVWLPYCGGKLILLMVRTPIGAWFEVPIQVISAVENILTDAALVIFAGLFYIFTAALKFLYTVSMGMDPPSLDAVLRPSKNIASAALERLGNATLAASTVADVEGHEYLYASMAAHASLKGIEQDIKDTLSMAVSIVATVSKQARTEPFVNTISLLIRGGTHTIVSLTKQLAAIQITLPSIMVWDAPDLAPPAPTRTLHPVSRVVLDPALAFWSARDRALTAGVSYLFIALVGCLYLSLSPPIFRSGRIRQIEQHITDILDQAGGVIKVILIITIEMITFPLFCGFLLDMALLPLFENATISTRMAFTVNRPWTSGFVHWFVGTCYMFHFALFVSMCRKIMRPGVLYFIRDPDDPTFHPVRDVLERSVATQLRKIAFSAIVYGALISFCLGGVVWGLWVTFPAVLPLHWSSSKSALEFPLDILFYNFLTPLVLRYAKPSDGLHTMYKWWFRRCARFLRLSDFLFGERLADEEGYATDQSFLASSLRFLTLNQSSSANTGGAGQDKPEHGLDGAEEPEKHQVLVNGRIELVQGPAFEKTGRYVRAPATDQVRIPKGQPVFVPVTEDNQRLDGKPEDEGIHASDSNQTKFVYIPPWFTLRISTFVVTIWLFAAVTGCGITIVPLVAGRWMITTAGKAVSPDLFNDETKVNDIYAFSLGVYSLGGIVYLALHLKPALTWTNNQLRSLGRLISTTALGNAFVAAGRRLAQVARLIYISCFLLIVLPLTLATILELYLLMPLHTLSTDMEKTISVQSAVTRHTIHLVQDWTLGLLLSRIVVKLVLRSPDSLLYRASREVIANRGLSNPSARLATRYFMLPFGLVAGTVIAGPFALAQMANKTVYAAEPEFVKVLVGRLVYPLCSGALVGVYAGVLLARATERWRGRIRDEIYLIGERLHNFGERRAPPPRSAGSGKGKERAVDVSAADIGA